jgi:Ca-activated chloride channel homolog
VDCRSSRFSSPGAFAILAIAVGFVLSTGRLWPQQAPAAPPNQAAPAASQGAPVPIAPVQEPPLKVTTNLVHLVVTVMDRHHEFITDLDKSDFKVLENGQPQQIRFFGRETDLPLRIGVLLDTSNSIRQRLQFEKDAAVDFLDRVIRPDKDMAFLMTFDNDPQVIQDYTDDRALLTSAIRDQRAGGGTALNDAIYLASQKLAKPPLPKGNSDIRRVVVLISDGEDNLSDRALSEAIDASIRAETVVFTISTNTDWIAIDNPEKPHKYNLDPGDKILQQFATQTGGQSFFPYSTDDLSQSFLDIDTELRSQYYIAYLPSTPPDGQYRTIDVQADRKGLIVRTRRGYYAAAPQSGDAGLAR